VRICRQFAATVAEPDGINIKATASAGLAGTQAAARTLDDLMMAADRALYRAKELGRDRIEQAAPREAIAA